MPAGMDDEQQLRSSGPPPEIRPVEDEPAPPVEPAAGPPEREPFWGYSDLFLFAGLAIPCLLTGWAVVKGLMLVFHLHARTRVQELLPEQFLGYALLFGALTLIFRVQYDRPFWRSLAWRSFRMLPLWVVICGLATAILVSLASTLIRTPTTSNPMTEMMRDPTSVILLAIFGITAGPLCEELAFRGFLQPLLVRSLGAAPGVVAAAIPFGLLHFQEYGNSWKHVLLISSAGAAFGWMRQATGSTRASTIMHAAYNGLFFFALFLQRNAGGRG
jgi:uncharacterized protein